jgi:hypothetical protein
LHFFHRLGLMLFDFDVALLRHFVPYQQAFPVLLAVEGQLLFNVEDILLQIFVFLGNGLDSFFEFGVVLHLDMVNFFAFDIHLLYHLKVVICLNQTFVHLLIRFCVLLNRVLFLL